MIFPMKTNKWQFWQNFQTPLVLLIPNCTRHRMITYTDVSHLSIKDVLEISAERKFACANGIIVSCQQTAFNKINVI